MSNLRFEIGLAMVLIAVLLVINLGGIELPPKEQLDYLRGGAVVGSEGFGIGWSTYP